MSCTFVWKYKRFGRTCWHVPPKSWYISTRCRTIGYSSLYSYRRQNPYLHNVKKKLYLTIYLAWENQRNLIAYRLVLVIRGGADKSLVWTASRCRRTESIVSLEKGVCSCAELQDFSCYRGWNEARQATRAISTTWRRELASLFFFLQGKAPKEIHVILKETLGEHEPLYATVKNWVAEV